MNRHVGKMTRQSFVLVAFILMVLILLLASVKFSSSRAGEVPNPAKFGAMTCQQLWYVEQQVLAEGRVCLKSARARTAFRRAKRCISSSENILPPDDRNYLVQLRQAAREKGCAGF